MDEHGGVYAFRDIEVSILEHVERVVADTTGPLRVAAVTGPRGYQCGRVVLDGVAPRLERYRHLGVAHISGSWDPHATIQFCGDVSEVPGTPPPALHPVRLLILPTTDFSMLPGWILAEGPPEARTFPVGPLSLVEAQHLIEATLQGDMDLVSMHTLAKYAGFVPAMLSSLVQECLDQGGLEQINGVWRVLGDPVRQVMLPYLRAQLAAAPPEVAEALLRIALAEPVALRDLCEADQPIAATLLREGELHREEGGTVRFTAPAITDALRMLSPREEQDLAYRRAIERGEPGLTALQWAAQHDRTTQHIPVDTAVIERAAVRALKQHDWVTVTKIAEIADTLSAHDTSDRAELIRARINVVAATAARFLPDPELAHAHLDRVESRLQHRACEEAAETLVHARIVRAELCHYHDGNLDGALDILDTPADPHQPLLASHRVIHLVYGGRIRDAQHLIDTEHQSLRQASHPQRIRVAIAEALSGVASGKPKHALGALMLLATHSDEVTRQMPWLTEELRTAGLIAALSADGPAAFQTLNRFLRDTRDGGYQPDLVTFTLGRASQEYVSGNIVEADRLATLALDTSEYLDPSGVQAALIALAAETAALTGNRERARTLHTRFLSTAPRSAAVIAGCVHGHAAASLLLLETPYAGQQLCETARQFIAAGEYGFASDVLYAGVRFGARRATAMLLEIAQELDGALHGMRVDHARGLLEADPVALLAVGDRLRDAGLHLYAAEADAACARVPGIPAAALRTAIERVASFVREGAVPGHAGLQRVARMSASGAEDLTPREREIAALIEVGLTNREIADRLSVSTRTVEGHVTRIYRKVELVRRAPGRGRDPLPGDSSLPVSRFNGQLNGQLNGQRTGG